MNYEDFMVDDDMVVEENLIDVDDEMSIIEAAVDIEIAEACKKEGRGVCEKCGKPAKECTCSGSKGKSTTESTDDLDDDEDDDLM